LVFADTNSISVVLNRFISKTKAALFLEYNMKLREEFLEFKAQKANKVRTIIYSDDDDDDY